MPKSHRRHFLLICASVLIAVAPPGCASKSEPAPKLDEYCSMVALLSDPERYDGRVIETEGVLLIEFEGDSIWLSQEHFEARIVANSIGVVPPYENPDFYAAMRRLNGTYVLIRGLFNKGNPREIGTPRGAISEISKLIPLDPKFRERCALPSSPHNKRMQTDEPWACP